MWCAICIDMFNWWGKGWPMVACPFWALVVLYRMLSIFSEYRLINVWATPSAFFHLPRMFLSTDFLFEKWVGLVFWTPSISYWHNKLSIISRRVSGLATDSLCSVWGFEWTTCLPCGGPILGYDSKRQLVCKFDMVERNFLLMFCFYHCLYILPKFYLLVFFSKDLTLK